VSVWSGRLRRRKARLGLHAPVTVRPHVAWHWRVLSLAGAVALGTVVTVAASQWIGPVPGAAHQALETQLSQLQAEIEGQQQRLSTLQALANSADAQLKVERTAVEALSMQVRQLEADNARLKADLGYFERLLPAAAGQAEGMLSLRGLEVKRESRPAGEHLIYRALLSQLGRDAEFSGQLQVQLNATLDGKPVSMVWPLAGDADAAAKARLIVKRHQRIEGELAIPAGWQLRSVQVRVLERSQIRASQSTSL
jgi:hypothetical protein